MSVKVLDFGTMPNNGKEVKKIVMTNANGFSLSVITYGANISNIIFNGVDVALGFEDLYGYINGVGYVGATVGRYANRIAQGRFTLNGRTYIVGKNEIAHGGLLHGGIVGFDKKVWDYEIIDDGDEPKVKFSVFSPDGDMGFPGNMNLSATFTVYEKDTYRIDYEATTDKDTVINVTNHAFFNLNGFEGEDILSTELQINAEYITPIDEHLIPTGEYMDVTGTALDFRQMKPIGRDIDDKTHRQMQICGGFDHNYVLGDTMELRKAATAHSPITGITLDVITDQPAVQLYTSNFLNDNFGKNGLHLGLHRGFCLEPQHNPDSPNNENFPTTTLKAGEKFTSTSIYSFTIQ